MRSPALISAYPKAGCHAVLASLSGRYPPLEGRSPTCYSPVCHSTYPLRGFRVRLACVRHAASVDSEPGSNSRLKPDVCRRKLADRHLRARKPEMALSCEITRTCARVIHLTTGTFNLIVKDRKQAPPEGTVFSPERSHTSANPSVLETFQTYRAELLRVNPLCSQDFHLIFTLGSYYRLSRGRRGPRDSGTLKDSKARLPLGRCAEFQPGTRPRHTAAEEFKLEKRSLGGCCD